MPSTPEIEEKLRLEQEAKKRGEQPTFASVMRETTMHRTPSHGGAAFRSASEELTETESLFGQQCVALGAHLRSMLATLAQLQRARMRAFGVTETREEQEFRRQAERLHGSPSVGEDGFVTNNNTGGNYGNVSG